MTALLEHPKLTAFLGGALVALSFPPRGWWSLAPIGLALVILVWSRAAVRSRALLGFVTGIGFFGTALVLVAIGGAPILVFVAQLLAAALLATLVAVMAVLTPPGRAALVGAPAAFVLVTAVKAYWPFGGLPGIGVAFGQLDGPLAVVAPLGGEFALVGAVALTGAVLAAPAVAGRTATLGLGGFLALVLLAGWLLPGTTTVGQIEVAAVQGGGVRGVDAMPADVVEERHLAAAQRLQQPVDLVLFPEGMIHTADVEGDPDVAEVAAIADRLDTVVVTGLIESLPGPFFSNDAYVYGPDGNLIGRYIKVHGVPFAEYIPGRSMLGRLIDLSLVPSDIVQGEEPGLVPTPAGDLGIVISFEVFFPRLVRDLVVEGAQIVLVPTNAASFEGGQVPSYEISAARLRAIETGRAVVQAAPTGFTALIDPDGQVRAITRLGEDVAVISRTMPLREGATPFVVWGNLPVVVLAVLALAGTWVASQRPRPAEPDQRDADEWGVPDEDVGGPGAPTGDVGGDDATIPEPRRGEESPVGVDDPGQARR